MRRRLSTLLGIKQYSSADKYVASQNVTQPRFYSVEQEESHKLKLAKQMESQYSYKHRDAAKVDNVNHSRRMSAFMPVLGDKRRKSRSNEGRVEPLSHRKDPLNTEEHIVNMIEINNLVDEEALRVSVTSS